MATTKTASEAIDAALNSPRSKSLGDISATAHSIPDLIAADKHQARKAAAASASMGVRIGVMRGPEQY